MKINAFQKITAWVITLTLLFGVMPLTAAAAEGGDSLYDYVSNMEILVNDSKTRYKSGDPVFVGDTLTLRITWEGEELRFNEDFTVQWKGLDEQIDNTDMTYTIKPGDDQIYVMMYGINDYTSDLDSDDYGQDDVYVISVSVEDLDEMLRVLGLYDLTADYNESKREVTVTGILMKEDTYLWPGELELYIPAGITVIWKASMTGESGGNYWLDLSGGGRFILAEDGFIGMTADPISNSNFYLVGVYGRVTFIMDGGTLQNTGGGFALVQDDDASYEYISGTVEGGIDIVISLKDFWPNNLAEEFSDIDPANKTVNIHNAQELALFVYDAQLSADTEWVEDESGNWVQEVNYYFPEGDYTGWTVNLAANIDLSANYWHPFHMLGITFNGNGYTISGMKVWDPSIAIDKANEVLWYATSGLFGALLNSTVQNLVIEDPVINQYVEGYFPTFAAGAVAGYIEGSWVRDVSIIQPEISIKGVANNDSWMTAFAGGAIGYAREVSNFPDVPSPGVTPISVMTGIDVYGGGINVSGGFSYEVYNDFALGSNAYIGGVIGANLSGLVGSNAVYDYTYIRSDHYDFKTNARYVGGIAGYTSAEDAPIFGTCLLNNFSTAEIDLVGETEIERAGGIAGLVQKDDVVNNLAISVLSPFGLVDNEDSEYIEAHNYAFSSLTQAWDHGEGNGEIYDLLNSTEPDGGMYDAAMSIVNHTNGSYTLEDALTRFFRVWGTFEIDEVQWPYLGGYYGEEEEEEIEALFVNNNEVEEPTVKKIKDAIDDALDENDTVNVTGKFTGADEPLRIYIPHKDKKVVWEAQYSGGYGNYLVEIVGPGTMEIIENGSIENSEDSGIALSFSATLLLNGGKVEAGDFTAITAYDDAVVKLSSGTVETLSNNEPAIDARANAAVIIDGGQIYTDEGNAVLMSDDSVIYVTSGGGLSALWNDSITKFGEAVGYYLDGGSSNNEQRFDSSFTAGTDLFRLNEFSLTADGDEYVYDSEEAHSGTVKAEFPAGLEITSVTANPLTAANTFIDNTVTFGGTYDEEITLDIVGTLADGRIPVNFSTGQFAINIDTPVEPQEPTGEIVINNSVFSEFLTSITFDEALNLEKTDTVTITSDSEDDTIHYALHPMTADGEGLAKTELMDEDFEGWINYSADEPFTLAAGWKGVVYAKITGTNGLETLISTNGIIVEQDNITGTPPAITTTELPGGKVGAAYSQALAATGDTPITWELESGNLPDGLTLAEDGTISGTPTKSDSFSFTVKAVNSEGNDTKALSIQVAPADDIPIVLGGTVTVGGTARFDQTLTANTNGLTPANRGTLSYQWLRGTANIPGATGASYKLVQADIGQRISVRVTASNATGSVTSAQTAAIAKAPAPRPAKPGLSGRTHNTVTLRTVVGMEYSRDGRTWQSGPVFRGLKKNTSYSFYIRRRATATHDASPASIKLDVRTLRGVTAKPKTSAVPKSRTGARGYKVTLKAPKGTTLFYATAANKKLTARVRPNKRKTLTIRRNTTVRVIAVRTGFMPSKEIRRTYRVK